jgi:hypothetical protein
LKTPKNSFEKLDERRSVPTLVAWFVDEEARWRLAIAGPRFDELIAQGLRSAYAETVEALAEIETASLMGSQVPSGPHDVFAGQGTCRDRIHRASRMDQAHRAANVIDGSFIREIIVDRSAFDAA